MVQSVEGSPFVPISAISRHFKVSANSYVTEQINAIEVKSDFGCKS